MIDDDNLSFHATEAHRKPSEIPGLVLRSDSSGSNQARKIRFPHQQRHRHLFEALQLGGPIRRNLAKPGGQLRARNHAGDLLQLEQEVIIARVKPPAIDEPLGEDEMPLTDSRNGSNHVGSALLSRQVVLLDSGKQAPSSRQVGKPANSTNVLLELRPYPRRLRRGAGRHLRRPLAAILLKMKADGVQYRRGILPESRQRPVSLVKPAVTV